MAAGIHRLLLSAVLLAPLSVRAQQADTSAFARALDLEGAGNARAAAPLYRAALHGPQRVNALLGLERVYADLGITDSLLAPLDTLIAEDPTQPVFRSVQLRANAMLSRDDRVRSAFEAWIRAVPGSPAPYRDYAQLLLQAGRPAAADSVIALAGRNLGTTSPLAMELAESRAAVGQWRSSAQAWRGALATNPDLAAAAAFSLAPAPDSVRPALAAVLQAPPAEVGPRRALAQLETGWGAPTEAWAALRGLPPDSAAVDAWLEYAQQAAAQERWPLARDAYLAAWHAQPNRALALQAAVAALNAGDPKTALSLVPAGAADSAEAVASGLPIRVRALAVSGRPAEAEALVRTYSHLLLPVQRAALEESVAYGWVRIGRLDRAGAALDSAGPDADSSDAAGWLALYRGDLEGARAILRNSPDASPELAQALGLITRTADDSAPDVGAAFLALARADSTRAASAFERAAPAHADIASGLWAMAARIHAARHEGARAIAIWTRIVHDYPGSPEAPAAELAWARQLRAGGDASGALARLEHLILTYPESALVPQARRELQLARRAIPPGGAGGAP